MLPEKKKENIRKEAIIKKLHLDKNQMRKQLRNFEIIAKSEESRNKEIMRVNKRLIAKIRAIQKNVSERKGVMCKNASLKGK